MPTYFPTLPDGAVLTHWEAMPRDWKKVTEDFEYEDGGKDFNEVSDDPVRRWKYEVAIPQATHAAAKAIADLYDAFFETVRYSQPFIFVDKYGDGWTNVYIETDGYTRTHDAHKSWIIFVKFQLVGYNSIAADVTPPSVPTGLTATPISSTTIRLTWEAATDPVSPIDGGTSSPTFDSTIDGGDAGG